MDSCSYFGPGIALNAVPTDFKCSSLHLAALFAALEAEHTQARQTYVASANALLDAYGRILALARVAQDLGCQPLPAFMFHNLMLPKPADMSDCDAPLAPCGNEPYQMGNAYSFVAIISGHQDRLRAAYP